MTRIRNLCVNFSLFILVLLSILFITELLVRLLYKDEMTLFPRYHTEAQYGEFTLRKIRPNSEFWHTSPDGSWKFTINSQGFRNNKDFQYHKKQGTIRVVSLGDSHTQGFEVRQGFTFSAITEKSLNNQGYNAEVINTGVSGFSTSEQLLFLENEGVKYGPDFVVLAFYANDFEDNIKAGLFRLDKNGNLRIQKKRHIPGVRVQNAIYKLPLVKWMSENSYFYSLLFNNVWKYFKTRLAKKNSEMLLEYATPIQHEFTDYQTALTSALVRRMYQFCHNNEIKLIIIDIPRTAGEKGIKSSFSSSFLPTVESYSDAYINSEELFADYVKVAEIHLPHGARHISEFTHTILGVSVANRIRAMLP